MIIRYLGDLVVVVVGFFFILSFFPSFFFYSISLLAVYLLCCFSAVSIALAVCCRFVTVVVVHIVTVVGAIKCSCSRLFAIYVCDSIQVNACGDNGIFGFTRVFMYINMCVCECVYIYICALCY